MNITNTSYPDFDKMQKTLITYLKNDEESKRKLEEHRKEYGRESFEFDITMFSQLWGSTCTAFDVLPNGEPAFGGCAMTRAYTVVLHELITDSYGVFVDNKPCYVVTNPTKEFLKDLKAHNLKSLSKAKELY